MRNFSTITLCLLLLLLNSCKKEEDTPRALPFMYLATKDVAWKFHFQGRHDSLNNLDTSYHRYATAKPSGETELVKGDTAYYYYIKADNYKSGVFLYADSGVVLLREDVHDKHIYMLRYYPGIWVLGDYDAVDFSDYSGETWFDYRKGNLSEFEDGTISIDGIAITKSSVIIPGKGSRFFKARGIGSPYGPFGYNASIEGHGGYLISMDFIYKGQSHHFDYE